MTIGEMVEKVEDAIVALKEVLEELGAVQEPPKPDPKEWKWEGVIGVQPEVLGTFPAGEYEFGLNVEGPQQLIGQKKDFRLLLIDELGKGRGQDREAQFHVENGATFSTLYFGGHANLGGSGWPGVRIDIGYLGRLGYEDFKVDVESEFALVLGELVTHDRGRVTSPAGTRYEIVMRKVG